jgi:hypothetical protein
VAKIQNIHLLEDVFGCFPSFHDAEVLRIVLDRGDGGVLPTLEAHIYVFEMTSEIKDGKYILKNRSLVTFQFVEIDELSLEGFNHQNVLSALSINNISDQQSESLKFEVHFGGIFGVDVRFRCRDVKIAAVEPFSN